MDLQQTDSPQLEPNLIARTKRHSRVFLKTVFFSRMLFRLLLDVKAFFSRKRASRVALDKPIEVRDPRNTLFRQVLAAAAALFVITSLAPRSLLDTGFSADYYDDTDFVDQTDVLPPAPFVMNDEGFVLKTTPVSQDSNRVGLTDFAQHTVVPGDTCSGVASLYGISVDTLVWENDLSDQCKLKVGQTLVVPPVDGVSCEVISSSQTLNSIAKKCSGDVEKIKAFNHLSGDAIAKGQRLFVPGGKLPQEAPVIAVRSGVRASGRTWGGNTFDRKIVFASNDVPVDGSIFIKPSDCHVTQGFRRGHYAVDCANPAKPDIVAAAPGIILSASGGCPDRDVKYEPGCGHGYGNNLIERVDNVVFDGVSGFAGVSNIQILSAHCETLYVSEGQHVDRGQAICKMGSSGNVHGATGIHLHTEIMVDGVKKNPLNYLF